jgi:hypothetical protein
VPECEPGQHSEGNDPRHAGFCIRCGLKIDYGTPRNLDLERELTHEAARGAVDPTRLIEHSEARASSLSGEYVPDPMLIAPGRDRLRDVREELSDSRNHLCWWLQAHVGDDRQDDALICLRFICLAYDRLLEDV